jgi:hypothetical protein
VLTVDVIETFTSANEAMESFATQQNLTLKGYIHINLSFPLQDEFLHDIIQDALSKTDETTDQNSDANHMYLTLVMSNNIMKCHGGTIKIFPSSEWNWNENLGMKIEIDVPLFELKESDLNSERNVLHSSDIEPSF